jgi:hypothetical protein
VLILALRALDRIGDTSDFIAGLSPLMAISLWPEREAA